MSYFLFHLVFILPPIVLLLWLIRRQSNTADIRLSLKAIVFTALIAFVYTTPWDNYLLYREVWWYGEDRVWKTIGFVPVEEYLFFLLQPFLTGLFYIYVTDRNPDHKTYKNAAMVHTVLAVVFGLLAIAGFVLLLSGIPEATYMGLILAWALPVITIMWIYGRKSYMVRLHTMGKALLITTLYLCVADWFAITNGIWDISYDQSSGIRPFGLPIEEATFFLFTNVLCICGVSLFKYGKES